MHKADVISGCFWIAFSIIIGVYSVHLGLGTMSQPGPGFLFFWMSVALAIMAVYTIIKAVQQGGARQSLYFLHQGINFKKILMVLIALFLYVILLQIIGFVLLTFFLFVYLLAIVEKRKWRFSIITSILVTVGAYLVFETWLQSRLPAGLLEFLRY